MKQCLGTYQFIPTGVILYIEATDGVSQTTYLSRNWCEPRESLWERAYMAAEKWADDHEARLVKFDPVTYGEMK